jgi:hypothetical protein
MGPGTGPYSLELVVADRLPGIVVIPVVTRPFGESAELGPVRRHLGRLRLVFPALRLPDFPPARRSDRDLFAPGQLNLTEHTAVRSELEVEDDRSAFDIAFLPHGTIPTNRNDVSQVPGVIQEPSLPAQGYGAKRSRRALDAGGRDVCRYASVTPAAAPIGIARNRGSRSLPGHRE